MSPPNPLPSRWSVRLALLSLAVGALVGPLGLRLIEPGIQEHVQRIETLSEIALAACLFCVGLRLRVRLDWAVWRVPVRLATLALAGTILIIAGAAHIFFNLIFAEALLLGAILAPTDPVLASDVKTPLDEEQHAVRFSLAAEGAIGSVLAFPAIIFSLGLLGFHDSGLLGWRWVTIDLVWALASGALIGWFVGKAAAWVLTRFDSDSEIGLLSVVLAPTCIVLAYAGAIAVAGYGFCSVLVCGASLARGGRLRLRPYPPTFSGRLQNIAQYVEWIVVLIISLLLGAMVATVDVRPSMFLFALLLLAARPLAVRLGLGRARIPEGQRQLVGWFGVHGTASVFYLMYSIDAGVGGDGGKKIMALTLAVLVTSIVVHGLSSTLPLVPKQWRPAE